MKKSAMPNPSRIFNSWKNRKKKKIISKTCSTCNGDGGGVNGPDCKKCGGSGVIILKDEDAKNS